MKLYGIPPRPAKPEPPCAEIWALKQAPRDRTIRFQVEGCFIEFNGTKRTVNYGGWSEDEATQHLLARVKKMFEAGK